MKNAQRQKETRMAKKKVRRETRKELPKRKVIISNYFGNGMRPTVKTGNQVRRGGRWLNRMNGPRSRQLFLFGVHHRFQAKFPMLSLNSFKVNNHFPRQFKSHEFKKKSLASSRGIEPVRAWMTATCHWNQMAGKITSISAVVAEWLRRLTWNHFKIEWEDPLFRHYVSVR